MEQVEEIKRGEKIIRKIDETNRRFSAPPKNPTRSFSLFMDPRSILDRFSKRSINLRLTGIIDARQI